MEPTQVNGFMVVRMPALNRDQAGRGAFSTQPPCLDDICYGGVDRMPWFEIDEQFYAGTLPAPLVQARRQIGRSNTDLSGLNLCRDLDLALTLLQYCNRIDHANELIAVHSDGLTPFKGLIAIDPAQVEWLGYDVVALGQQSLLNDGLFTASAAFTAWRPRLNKFGLLPSRDMVERYAAAYHAAAGREEVEDVADIAAEVAGLGYTIAAIHIARVRA